MQTLDEVRYIPKLRKNLISLGTLQKNGFYYKFDGDTNIMKLSKGELIEMRAMMNTCNIHKSFGNTIVDDVASAESDNDATNL